MNNDKLQAFAELLEKEQIEYLHKYKLACNANIINAKVTIKNGSKYIKVDIGTSGRYIVDAEGNIFGIKGYGVINKKHYYGTLDTITNYYWGGFKGVRKGGTQ